MPLIVTRDGTTIVQLPLNQLLGRALASCGLHDLVRCEVLQGGVDDDVLISGHWMSK